MNEIVTYKDKTLPWTVAIRDVQRYDNLFVHIRCALPDNASLSAGDTVAIDIAPPSTVLRRYTVSRVSADSFEFIACRTEQGPATAYLDRVSPGDDIFGQGPERPVKLPTSEMAHVAVMGDETVIGTAMAVTGATSSPVSIAVKTSRAMREIIDAMDGATLSMCPDDDAMRMWLTSFLESHGTQDSGVILVGEQSANQALRQHAFSLGLDKGRLATRTYWRPDKSGLE